MIAVTSPGFVLFAALLAGLWYACPPPRRWQLLLGANLLFYAVLCPAALPVLAGSSFLVWWCGRRTAKKPVFLAYPFFTRNIPVSSWIDIPLGSV